MPIVALLKVSSQAAEAWRAGARGLLVGHLDPDSLGAALTAASHGFAIIEPTLVSALAQVEVTQSETQVEALPGTVDDDTPLRSKPRRRRGAPVEETPLMLVETQSKDQADPPPTP